MKRLLLFICTTAIFQAAGQFAPLTPTIFRITPKQCNQPNGSNGVSIFFNRDFSKSENDPIITSEPEITFTPEENSIAAQFLNNTLSVSVTDSENPTPPTRFSFLFPEGGSPFSFVGATITVNCNGVATVEYEAILVAPATLGSVVLQLPNGEVRTNTTISSPFFDNLTQSGTYTITYNANSTAPGCQDPLSITFEIRAEPFRITSIETTPQTSPEGGTVTVSLAGGTPPYTYILSGDGGNLVIIQTNQQNTSLTFTSSDLLLAGSYTVRITDSSDNDPRCTDENDNVIIDLLENPAANYIATNAKFGCSTD